MVTPSVGGGALLVLLQLLDSCTPLPQWRSGSGPGNTAAGTNQDPLRWVWIDASSLALEWPSKFALSINGAVTAYSLSLSHPERASTHDASTHDASTSTTTTTTLFHARTLRHQFEGLSANLTYSGRLVALVGRHHWPYTLLNFSIASPALHTGLRLGQRVGGGVASGIGDLEGITVAVRLRWSTTPFIAEGVRAGGEMDAAVAAAAAANDAGGGGGGGGGSGGGGGEGGGPTVRVRPVGYRLKAWDAQQMVAEVTTSASDKNMGCEATVGGLQQDTMYKVSLQAVWPEEQPGPALSFSLHTGALEVAGGGLTTDGVSECYSGLQVRCPGAERCVSPYWICDGAPDCPDGADEVGCEDTPCSGFHCYDDACIASAWRCDGHRDCKNGDDEFACPDCLGGEIACPQGGGCIPANATCDGIIHCPDGWDEAGHLCGSLGSCGLRELRCLEGGRCVPHHQLCDGTPHCPAAEDEDSTFCSAFTSVVNLNKKPLAREGEEGGAGVVSVSVPPCKAERSKNCTEEEFECESGECIHHSYICNGIRDCRDGEDEMPHRCLIASTAAAPPPPRTHNPRRFDSEEDDYESAQEGFLDTTDLEYRESDPWCDGVDAECEKDVAEGTGENLPVFTESPEGVTVGTASSNSSSSQTLDTPTRDTPTQGSTTLRDEDQSSDTGTSLDTMGRTTESASVPTTARSDEEDPVVTTDGSTEEGDDDTTNNLDHTNTIMPDDVDISVDVIVEDPVYPDTEENDFNLSSSEEQAERHHLTHSTNNTSTSTSTSHIDPSHHTTTTTATTTTTTTPHLLPTHTSSSTVLQNTTDPTTTTSRSSKQDDGDGDGDGERQTDSPPTASPVSEVTMEGDFDSTFLGESSDSDDQGTPAPSSGNSSLIVRTTAPDETEEVEEEEEVGDDESYDDLATSDEETTHTEEDDDDDDDDDETRTTPDNLSTSSSTVSPPSDIPSTTTTTTTTTGLRNTSGTSSHFTSTPPSTTTTTLPQASVSVWSTSATRERPQTHSSLPDVSTRVPHSDAEGDRPATEDTDGLTHTTTTAATTTTTRDVKEDTFRATPATRRTTEATRVPTEEGTTTGITQEPVDTATKTSHHHHHQNTTTTTTTTSESPGVVVVSTGETSMPTNTTTTTTTSESPGVVVVSTGGTSMPTNTTTTTPTTSSIKIASSMPPILTSTDPEDWKDMPAGQNLTILIAVHSELNESNSNRIPQYVIHGVDGSTYSYEVVSIVKEQLDEEKKKEEAEREATVVIGSDGTHQYLQGNERSSGAFVVPSLSLFLVVVALVRMAVDTVVGV